MARFHHEAGENLSNFLHMCAWRVDGATGAVTPPIHMASTFERAAGVHLRPPRAPSSAEKRSFSNTLPSDLSYPTGFVYGRIDNPTRKLLEENIADIEVCASAFVCFPP